MNMAKNIKITIKQGDLKKDYSLDEFKKDTIVIGRKTDSDIIVTDEHVSGHHGCFFKENGEWFYQDLNSTNGTFLNNEKIITSGLSAGDVLILGVETDANAVCVEVVSVSDSADSELRNKKRIIWIIAGASVVVAVCMIVVLFFVFNSGKSGSGSGGGSGIMKSKDFEAYVSTEEQTAEITIDQNELPTDAETYFRGMGKVIKKRSANDSTNAYSVGDLEKELTERGFSDLKLECSFTMDGEYLPDHKIGEDRAIKYPMYEGAYVTPNNELWTITVVDNQITAYPVSYNYESKLGFEVVLAEKEQLIAYVGEENRFYDIVPASSVTRMIIVDKISSEVLNSMNKEKIDAYFR